MDRSKWKRVRFGDVVRCVDKTCRNPEAEGLTRVVGLEHLDPGELKITRWADVADGTSFTRTFRAGQVLFGKRRAYQRKAARAEFDGICSGDILVFEAIGSEIVPPLLPFIVQTQFFWDRAVSTSAGSLSPRTKWKDLAGVTFLKPPIDEQLRLADIFLHCELTCHSYSAAAEVASQAYRARISMLLEATSDCQLLPVKAMGEVQLGRQRAPKYQTGEHSRPYLRVANVFDGFFDLDDVLKMDFDEADFQRYHLKPDDILLNEGQSRELVGRCALWEGEIAECCFQNTLIRFRCGKQVLPRYALHLFRAAFYAGVFSAVAKQTTSIAHLGGDRFASLVFPLPSIEAQRRATNEIEALASAETLTRAHVQKCKSLMKQLADLLVVGEAVV